MNLSHAPVIQSIKNRIVKMGPHSRVLRTALKTHARMHGFGLRFTDAAIAMVRGNREIDIPLGLYVEVPMTMEIFDDYFKSIKPVVEGGREVLDFSKPALHVFRRDNIGFYFGGVPEDDAMEAYEYRYKPAAGDTVWDAGAHAGASTYYLSKAVGPTGRVYAFEPDEQTYGFLLKNIELHGLTNVVPVRAALTDKTGTVAFQSDGSVAAGIREYLLYSDRGRSVEVPAISLADACAKYGHVPRYIKMDIEGAEVAVVKGSAEFLREHAIEFAIESYHPLADGELTYKELDRIFPEIGYEVESSARFGIMFTWARRRDAAVRAE